jgi:aminodeoxyfutalosine synthase
VRGGAPIDGVIPTPGDEPLGLDSLRVVALCRLRGSVPHVVLDFARLGHRLAQMCLGFGADELFGPIVAERALRLGDNANNPALTRKEAATLVRGAGLAPFERVSGGEIVPYAPDVPTAPAAPKAEETTR